MFDTRPLPSGLFRAKKARVARLRKSLIFFRGSEAGLDGAGVGDDGSVLRGILDFWGRGWQASGSFSVPFCLFRYVDRE
jgi:hypothetical protein